MRQHTETEHSRLPSLLTPKQVIKLLGLRTRTGHTLRNWEKRGLLSAVRLNARVVRYRASDIERLIAQGTAPQ